jgi:antitoxin VapB
MNPLPSVVFYGPFGYALMIGEYDGGTLLARSTRRSWSSILAFISAELSCFETKLFGTRCAEVLMLNASPEVERLARDLANATGESVDEAVVIALRERLDRYAKSGARLRRLNEIALELSRLRRNASFAEKDLYGTDGLPI